MKVWGSVPAPEPAEDCFLSPSADRAMSNVPQAASNPAMPMLVMSTPGDLTHVLDTLNPGMFLGEAR